MVFLVIFFSKNIKDTYEHCILLEGLIEKSWIPPPVGVAFKEEINLFQFFQIQKMELVTNYSCSFH